MDYEKKYNEALNWMRELYPGLHGATKEDAEHYFPELRESEDERIYNEIMEFFKMNEKRCIVDNSYTRWISWLEKQKEQKPAEWSEDDENVYKTIMDDFNGITQMSKAYKLKAADFLKSLRPQPHWKPSEEQIKALEDCGECKRCIKELCEQLKKLM